MKKSIILLILLGLAALSIGLTGCGAKGNGDSDDAALTMRAYTVPVSQTEAIAKTLRGLLATGKGNTAYLGDASVTSPGQIVVLAPGNMQDSIANSVKAIVSNAGTAEKPQPLRLNAWVVNTYPGKGPDDPQLKTIQPALDAFAADMGPSHFAEAHYLTAVSDAGAPAGISPMGSEALNYRITPTEGGVVLAFHYRYNGAHLDGQVTTKLSQNLVLGLASDVPDGANAHPVRRLLVVRIVPANQG